MGRVMRVGDADPRRGVKSVTGNGSDAAHVEVAAVNPSGGTVFVEDDAAAGVDAADTGNDAADAAEKSERR